MTLGSVTAMDDLAGAGFVTSGSMMAPCPWFPDVASMAARRPELDLGLHLTHVGVGADEVAAHVDRLQILGLDR